MPDDNTELLREIAALLREQTEEVHKATEKQREAVSNAAAVLGSRPDWEKRRREFDSQI